MYGVRHAKRGAMINTEIERPFQIGFSVDFLDENGLLRLSRHRAIASGWRAGTFVRLFERLPF